MFEQKYSHARAKTIAAVAKWRIFTIFVAKEFNLW